MASLFDVTFHLAYLTSHDVVVVVVVVAAVVAVGYAVSLYHAVLFLPSSSDA